MRRAPGIGKRLGKGLWLTLVLCCLLTSAIPWPWPVLPALAEDAITNEIQYIAPRLPADVDPYDPEHPEELQEEQLYAKAAILVEATSGEIIFEKNADERMYPASTTKILTTLLGIMMGDMSATITASATALDIPDDSSTIPLDVGETITFEDLLFATMLRSGNEGANMIAEAISGNYNDFSLLMNQAAAMYGCTNTNFVNPSGLHNNDHYTTARDMAKIAQAAMQNDTFRAIAKTFSYNLPRSNLQRSRVLVSGSDALLNPNIADNEYYYPYATGIKTGFHNSAGYCYVGSAEKEGVQLISVVFYTTRNGRWTDTKKLMEYGFSQFVSMTPEEMYNQAPLEVETSGFSLEDENLGRLPLELKTLEGTRQVHIVATKTEMEAMARNLKQTVLIEYTRDFAAPIEAGEVMGKMTYYPADGGSPVVYELVASRSIQRRLNAPKSLEEIEAEVYADPNPFPPFSVELLAMALAPFVGLFIIIRLLMRLFRRSGRHRKGRVPKPGNRYFR